MCQNSLLYVQNRQIVLMVRTRQQEKNINTESKSSIRPVWLRWQDREKQLLEMCAKQHRHTSSCFTGYSKK